MKKFDLYSQAHAPFDRFGCISGFRFVGTIVAFSAEQALRMSKQNFPLCAFPMIGEHIPDRAAVPQAPKANKEFIGTKRAWR